MKIKVFISWSGKRSLAVAETLYDWLPSVIQAIEPWMSPSEINKGGHWIKELELGLKRSKVGIICLAQDNLESPWLHFEAGAISKTIEGTLVCPFLIDLDPSDLRGPLAQFQSTKPEMEDIKRLIYTINNASGNIALADKDVDKSFRNRWPRLDKTLKQLKRSPSGIDNRYVLLDEGRTLQLVRMHQSSIAFGVSRVIDDTLQLIESNIDSFDSDDFFREIHAAILKGRSLCIGFRNPVLGDIVSYFEKDFSAEELRGITREIEPVLLDPKINSLAKRIRLFKRIAAIEEKVFSRLHEAMYQSRKEDS
jgi:hypothetical protein